VKAHERRIHSNVRPHDCPYCRKLFKTARDVKIHARVHTGAKPYSCKHCPQKFRRLDLLKTHLLKSHNEGTWFTCHICQKKFSFKGNLKLSNTCSDMKVWSRMCAMNAQSVSVQQMNWNNISNISQFTLTTNSSVVFYATDSSYIFAMLSSTSRCVLLYTVSAPFCCDYEQCVCATTDDISWQINSVCRSTVSAAENSPCFMLWLLSAAVFLTSSS